MSATATAPFRIATAFAAVSDSTSADISSAADTVVFVLHRRPYPAAEVISILMRCRLSMTDRPFDEQSLELIQQIEPALILLIVDSVDAEDVEAVQAIRRNTNATILLVIRTFSSAGVADALESGADAYVRESDGNIVLEAMVKSLLRRKSVSPVPRTPPRAIGDLVFRPTRRLVECQGRSIQLTGMEFSIVSALATAPDRVMSPAEILRAAGIPEPSTSANLKVHVLRIRRKLREICPEHEHIVNLRGVGYMLAPREQSD